MLGDRVEAVFASLEWDWLATEWARAILLFLLVLATIAVISFIYSGSYQSAYHGPIAIRPHVKTRRQRGDAGGRFVVPRSVMPMNMDGVEAAIRIYYIAEDARGRRNRKQVYAQRVKLQVQHDNLTRVQSQIFGIEPPDQVHTEDVYYPSFENVPPPEEISPTPQCCAEYFERHRLDLLWTEDDNAPRVSLSEAAVDAIREAREAWIKSKADVLRAARNGGRFGKWRAKRLAKKRVGAMGSYYVKFEFSHNPFFILFRHPDRDLKMTAWLTVLTSAFALIMDAWPLKSPDVEMRDVSRRAPVSSNSVPRP